MIRYSLTCLVVSSKSFPKKPAGLEIISKGEEKKKCYGNLLIQSSYGRDGRRVPERVRDRLDHVVSPVYVPSRFVPRSLKFKPENAEVGERSRNELLV